MSNTNKTLAEKIEEWLNSILSSYEPRKIRDKKVIRDPILGFNMLYKHEINLIDSPLLQRLRGIFQTSLALYTYPSAIHSRFEHSLGCVALAEKFLHAVEEENGTARAEVRLAALLHDCGHGPFSHASEKIYGQYKIFDDLEKEFPEIFISGKPKAHEILGYLIIKSKAFENLFKKIIGLYDHEPPFGDLSKVDLGKVAKMILGQRENHREKYLAQIINGPFDVDKLDYLQRDGYFTGLQMLLDLDRLFITVGTYSESSTSEKVLCVDISGATALEQLLFNKMLIYSSVYHHHKVRSGLCSFLALFEKIKNNSWTINGLSFSDPVDFLKVDDYDIFNSLHNSEELSKEVRHLKLRSLLKRALVIGEPLMEDDISSISFSRYKDKESALLSLRDAIAKAAKVSTNDIFIDFPDAAGLHRTAIEAMVRLSPDTAVPLLEIFPVQGWSTGYSQFRYRVYIFCPYGKEEAVARATYKVLKDENIRLKRTAFELAKHSKTFIDSVYKD